MEIYHPYKEFNPKFRYFFYDAYGKLSKLDSEDELKVGSVVVVDSFVSKYTMKVTRTWDEDNKIFIEWESFKVTLCDAKQN